MVAYRLHNQLLKEGLEASFLAMQKNSKEDSIHTAPFKFRLRQSINNKVSSSLLKLESNPRHIFKSLNYFSTGLHKWINQQDADVVHLHWVNADMISIDEIAKIKKPIVWTLHDMWAFCGAEHYVDLETPSRFEDNYSSSRAKDISGVDWEKRMCTYKQKKWKDCKFHFVTPSYWLNNCLSESFLRDHPSCVIRNGLDLGVFKPSDIVEVRNKLGLPLNKKLLGFGAIKATGDKRKGYDYLVKALHFLKESFSEELELVVFGADALPDKGSIPFKSHCLGNIYDEAKLSRIYCAIDCFIAPSTQENLPNTLVESLACGTPSVAFNIGGNSDIIDHKINGYLAKPFDSKDLADGIKWVLKETSLADKCRQKTIDCFDISKVTQQYLDLYEQVLLAK